MTKLVKMKREDGHEVDVHPAEVENYKVGGYALQEEAQTQKVTPKGKTKKGARADRQDA